MRVGAIHESPTAATFFRAVEAPAPTVKCRDCAKGRVLPVGDGAPTSRRQAKENHRINPRRIRMPVRIRRGFLLSGTAPAGRPKGLPYREARKASPLDKGRCPEGAEGSRAKHCRSPTACGGAPFFERGPKTDLPGALSRPVSGGRFMNRPYGVEPGLRVGAAISRPQA